MKSIYRAAAIALTVALAGPAWAGREAPPTRDDAAGPHFWVGLGAGGYTGKNYDAPAGCCADKSSYTVGGYAGHLSFNLAADGVLMRIRHSVLTDFTSNTAEETAIAAGLALTPERNLWVTVGVSRLADVSNSRKSPTVGVPIEILGYPVRGLELMVHGNINGDSSFIGIGVSGAIGRRRPR